MVMFRPIARRQGEDQGKSFGAHTATLNLSDKLENAQLAADAKTAKSSKAHNDQNQSEGATK